MRKKKRKPMTSERNCYNCTKCVYLSEGGYMCECNNEVVIEDFEPTDDFYSCGGKEFEQI
jgi:hypothetical protein